MNRNTLYRLQVIRQKFSWCPCGFFCKDCLREMIHEQGPTKGILWHIIYHTIIGKIYYEWKYRQPIKGLTLNEIYEMIID
jgi:hypothetical protein